MSISPDRHELVPLARSRAPLTRHKVPQIGHVAVQGHRSRRVHRRSIGRPRNRDRFARQTNLIVLAVFGVILAVHLHSLFHHFVTEARPRS